MRKALAIIISCCVLFQCVAHLGVIGYYELNKSFIARNLCENRNRPQMKCCGKCYLKKQLRKLDDQDPRNGKVPVKTEKSEALACILPEPIHLPESRLPQQKVSYLNPDMPFTERLFPTSVFHPPAAV